LSACITFNTSSLSPNLSVCYDGLGTGTITADTGKSSINFDLAGMLCVANGNSLVNPISLDYVFTGTYAVSGGTGIDATAVGSGSANFHGLFTATPPPTGTGEVQLTGNFAKS
jgi:hypothetical protein